MLLKTIPILFLATLAAASNPKVVTPKSMTYEAGKTMEITWSDAHTGFVNIDLIDSDPSILPYPMVIANGVPATDGKYLWTIPSNLKSAGDYSVRVWGNHQPTSQEDGISQKFSILNVIPDAINTFTVIHPNAKSGCIVGSTCQITWDFPQNGLYPAMVDISLNRVGELVPLMQIAQVSSSLKNFNWAVPDDQNLLKGDVYISVSGSGAPLIGPSMSNDMGGNSQAFSLAAKTAEDDKKEDDDDKEKKDEKKKKEDPKKEEPKIRGNTKKSNAATSVSVSVAGLAACVAAVAMLVV